MTYDEKQMIFTGAATPEESAALALHYEIATAARAAADSLLDLGRKIKRMRDTNGYKALGFETLGDYTKTAIGLNQRQAYNYIAVVEKLPAQLVDQNAAAGVTKLALLAQLTDGERQQVVAETDLQDVTVKELQEKIKELEEKNSGYAEQLCLLQSTTQPEADELTEEQQKRFDEMQARMEEAEKKRSDAEKAAKKADKNAKKLKSDLANEKAQRETLIEKARRDGAEDARKAAEEAARAQAEKALEAEKAARQQAEANAEELAKQLKVVGDEDTLRFSLLFDRVQGDVDEVLTLCDELRGDGKTEKAGKFSAALRKALESLAAAIETEE